ncbi:MAG: pilus assembly protein PilP [Deltaproteobacteria bacterium]|nr:pilus assembly protein PilP [Deltaproteobacteria bacterium]MBN2686906.1 pilus assembly protein PilP [Deltaproteobacteria bacterium]
MKKGKKQKSNNSAFRRYVGALAIICFIIVPALSCYGQDTASAESEPGFSYDPTGKIDPFKPFIKPKKEQAAVKERTRTTPLTPLEKYAVADLKLVGIAVMGDGEKIAMVEDTEGKFYPVVAGMPIGLNEGRVSQIADNQVIIVEEMTDIAGKRTTKQTIMKLKEKSEE